MRFDYGICSISPHGQRLFSSQVHTQATGVPAPVPVVGSPGNPWEVILHVNWSARAYKVNCPPNDYAPSYDRRDCSEHPADIWFARCQLHADFVFCGISEWLHFPAMLSTQGGLLLPYSSGGAGSYPFEYCCVVRRSKQSADEAT